MRHCRGWGIFFFVWSLAAHPAAAINITIDYKYDLPANGGSNFFFTATGTTCTNAGATQAKAALAAAANFYSVVLTDTFDAITLPSPYRSTKAGSTSTMTWSWQEQFQHPSSVATTVSVTNPSVNADDFTIYVGAAALPTANADGRVGKIVIPSPTESGSGGFLSPTDNNNMTTIDTNFRTAVTTRGETSGFARWGGAITFDSDGSTSWFFNHLATPTGTNVTDFYSVALHEIGHTLGFGTSTEWFSTNLIPTGTSSFVGVNAKAQNGGNPVPLDITTVGVPPLTHWISGKTSVAYGTSTSQEALMDPDLTPGTRKKLTELDAAGLKDIGWTFGPLPALNGDYNNNGVVDAGDYALWRKNLNRSVTLPNDTTPGTVVQADYTVWRTSFGTVGVAGIGSSDLLAAARVPEPASGLLILMFVLVACFNRTTIPPLFGPAGGFCNWRVE